MPLNFVMDPVRALLLAGLIFHKALWEVLKKRAPAGTRAVKAKQPLPQRITKVIKIAILLGIIAQTMTPVLFPIEDSSGLLRPLGVALSLFGLGVAVMGRLHLGDNWLDIEAAGVKGEQRTVANGIYAYIRHPIYTGDLFLLLGLELALGSWLFLGVFILALAVLRQAVEEERKLIESLPGYASYCQRTRRFIPFVV